MPSPPPPPPYPESAPASAPASSLDFNQVPSANVLETIGDIDPTRARTEIHLADGRVLAFETRLLTITQTPASTGPAADADLSASSERIVIPLIEEQLVVGRRTVETGIVRLEKTVQQYQQTLDEPLAVRTYDIERIILNRPVDAAPAPRVEGDTTIYPLVEEQLILTKQLILIEEVRITRRDTERRDQRTVTLTREHLTVEREQL